MKRFLLAALCLVCMTAQGWAQSLSNWHENPTTSAATNGAITATSFTCQNAAACVLSTLIQYSPSWARAKERTLLLRLEDTVSVKDFGAKGDGTTNDDAAIQNALTAICAHSPSPGGELFFPAGDYVISASAGHSIPCAGVTIRGTGGGAHQRGQSLCGAGKRQCVPVPVQYASACG
ncbi:glycosyl hydrolase family 28-related protein [Komagataeibacter kakiaceti]|uniref:glycosyl hydrolase family 28-related protein n=1 Tax=Komagataeibacter kakiaceti TaxID=943261 RepID=UPI000472D41B|nr:glycosyl hydrolase family 28-related protein [Komagataeibacter kakiaceti]